MHKYFKLKPPKVKMEEQTELNSDGEDPALVAFADEAIENKMKEFQAGSGIIDDSDDISIDYSGQEEGEASDSDFFGGEGLSDVDLGGEDDDEEGEEA